MTDPERMRLAINTVWPSLSHKERVVYVLLFVADPSFTEREVAEALSVTPQTVNYYRKKVLTRLRRAFLCQETQLSRGKG